MHQSLHRACLGLGIGYPSCWFPLSPGSARAPPSDRRLTLLGSAKGGVYTGPNDWNSLRRPVQAAGSYALSELASTIVGPANAGTTMWVATDLFRDDLVLRRCYDRPLFSNSHRTGDYMQSFSTALSLAGAVLLTIL